MKKTFLLGIMICLVGATFAREPMQWYSYWGSNVAGNQIEPQRMVVDADGNIYVAALFGGTSVAVESTTLNSNSAADKGDAVIVKLSPDKAILWTYPIVNAGSATITDIAVDHAGNVVATGAFTNSIKVGAGSMVVDDTNLGEQSIYVLRLTAAGQALNAFQIPAAEAKGGKLAIDSQDNIIVTGLLDGDATFIPGSDAEGDFQASSQIFVAKYAPNGTHMWHQFRNGIGSAAYGKPSVVVDNNDNVYVAASMAGTTTFAGQSLYSTAANAALLAYSATGAEQWAHVIWGDKSGEVGDLAYSPIGEVAIAFNHFSDGLFIDDLGEEFKCENAHDPDGTMSGFFAFDLSGQFKWFYDWGYCTTNDGSASYSPANSACYGLRCTDEGVWYATGYMTGRYGGKRLPVEERSIPAGKNSGVETVDNQWLQHNTNGGQDCYLLTLTREGKLANAVRPGGPQYEYGMDIALSPDKKSLYLLEHINVRNNTPYTCPDNLFDSWTDLYAPSGWESRKASYTLLNVYCPENDGSSTAYTKAYKGQFASAMLVKYALPEINPNALPYFTVGQTYNQTVALNNPTGVRHYFSPLATSGDVQAVCGENCSISFGPAPDANPRFVGLIAVDSIALPGTITYYGYDSSTKRSLRSQPRNVRYMPLLEGNNTALGEVSLDAAIYPTVCRDNINIRCEEKNYTVNIYSIDGRMVFSHDNVTVIGLGGRLPAGMYQVEVRAGKARRVETIIVQ